MCLTDQQCKRGRPESKLRGKRDTLGVCSLGLNVADGNELHFTEVYSMAIHLPAIS